MTDRLNQNRSISSHLDDLVKPAKDIMKVLEQAITNPWTRKKTPRWLKRSYGEAFNQKDENATSAIFLGQGLQAWVAYYLATQSICGGKHYSGQKDHGTLLAAFEGLCPEQRRAVAIRIKDVRPDQTVQVALQNIRKKLCSRARM